MYATSQVKMNSSSSSLVNLYVAAESGNVKRVKQLLGIHGPEFFNYQSTFDGNNALHVAFINKHDQIVDLLLEAIHVASTYHNFTNSMGLTHLHIACTRKDEKLIQSVLDAGASIESTVSSSSHLWAGFNAMHFAASYHSVQAIKVLLNAGMDHRSKTALGKTARDIIYQNLYDPLIIADLLEQKETDECRRKFSNFYMACLNEDHTVVQEFIDHGASNVNFRTNRLCDISPTPLHCAVEVRSKEKVQILLKNGAKIDCCEKYFLKDGKANVNKNVSVFGDVLNHYTPLHMAVHFDCPEIAELLVKHGASLNVYNCYYGTPLHMAFNLKRHNFLQLLLMKNVNFNFVTPLDEQTQLHLIIQLVYSRFDTIYGEILRDKLHTMGLMLVNNEMINVNAKDTDGNTALHYLCYYKASYVQVLLDLGADINVKNNEGKLPFLLAEDYRWLDFVQYSDVKPLLYHHVQNLKALDLKVDPENEKICRLMIDEKKYNFFKQGELTFREQLRLEEIIKLKTTMINDNTSLYNFMKLDCKHTKVYAGCETLKNIAQDVELKKKFPSYAYLIRLKYHAATGILIGEKIVYKSEPFE